MARRGGNNSPDELAAQLSGVMYTVGASAGVGPMGAEPSQFRQSTSSNDV